MRLHRNCVPLKGFTLIELLVVIIIIGTLASLSVGVYFAQIARAKQASTAAMIRIIDNALQDRLEAFYASTRQSVQGSTLNRYVKLADGTAVSGTATSEVQIVKTRRATLIARLDQFRGDFPQQFADFLSKSNCSANAGEPVGLGDPTVWGRGRAAIYREYLSKTKKGGAYQKTLITTANPQGTTVTCRPDLHTPDTESSECLFLILTSAGSEGSTFDVGQLDPRFVVDSDGDGLMEFVDSWGTPLRFYRWPTDYMAYLIDNTKQLSVSAGRNALDPDGLLNRTAWTGQSGIVNSFQGYSSSTPDYGAYIRLTQLNASLIGTNPNTEVTTSYREYPLIPIILSAGPDGQNYSKSDSFRAFGLTWPIDGSTPLASDLNSRSGRVGGPTDGTVLPDAAFVGDNIVSVLIRSGSEGQQ